MSWLKRGAPKIEQEVDPIQIEAEQKTQEGKNAAIDFLKQLNDGENLMVHPNNAENPNYWQGMSEGLREIDYDEAAKLAERIKADLEKGDTAKVDFAPRLGEIQKAIEGARQQKAA